MAVEIHILSGARQGQRIPLDAKNFRVGTDPGCEVFFDPRADASAKGRSASFQLMQDGWYMVRAAGPIVINYTEAAGPTMVRSGDIIRMSENGPDFLFSIGDASPARTKPCSPPDNLQPCRGRLCPLRPTTRLQSRRSNQS